VAQGLTVKKSKAAIPYRTNNTAVTEATGVSLINKRPDQDAGSNIDVRSESGRRSSFCVYFITANTPYTK
jgi:hypothetical protein